jgi:hypothetical protein
MKQQTGLPEYTYQPCTENDIQVLPVAPRSRCYMDGNVVIFS